MTDESHLGLVLWTTDILALSHFLETVAGMTVEARHPGFASLRLGGTVVGLHADEAYRGHPWYEAIAREGVARGIGAEIRVRVADVEAAYRAALNLGGLAIEAPCDIDDLRECQVMGPDGYVLSLWQPVEIPS
jgi:catechol 2,3-dioxygenase-like lactoylglutathione lyase family enzyme